MKNAAYYLFALIGAIPIAFLGVLSEVVRPGYRFEVERRLRGVLLGPFFGGKRLRLCGNLHVEGASNVRLGDGASIYRSVDLVAGPRGKVLVGAGTHIGRKTLVNGLGGGVTIGSNCSISSHVAIYTITNTKNGGINCGEVVIGDSVLVGSGVTILPGIVIGESASIGAGAVVTKNVSSGEVIIGVPGRISGESGG